MATDITPIKGFPEWLPEQRMVEQHIIERIRSRFELHGFAPIETRSIERIEHLTHKGATDKEIYVLRRIHADEGDPDTGFGLHFDLTVPFARYVAQYQGQLDFPIRRYQIQKAWRGERPRDGRFREFYQADADIIADSELPLHHDAEMALLLDEVLTNLPVPRFVVHVNNRKILQGFYEAIGIEDAAGALRIVDKLQKIGPEQVVHQLVEAGISEKSAAECIALGRIQTDDASFVDAVLALGHRGALLDQGLDELAGVMDRVRPVVQGRVVADLSIARGLDYYTGAVYEGYLVGHEDLGAVCSGGRYDNLAAMGSSKKLPGIGVSVGVSRILGRLFGQNLLKATRKTPSCVLVALDAAERRSEAWSVAASLRARGIAAEIYDLPQKFGKQIRYAEKKRIPFVWFLRGEKSGSAEVLDIRTGEQVAAEIETWQPPENDRLVRFTDD